MVSSFKSIVQSLISIPSVTVVSKFADDFSSFVKAFKRLVLPASPKPTSISLVRLHRTEPAKRRFKKAIIELRPRRTISGGGVLSDRQLKSDSDLIGSKLTLALK